MNMAADFEVLPNNTTIICKKCGWTGQIFAESVRRQPESEELASLPFQALQHFECPEN